MELTASALDRVIAAALAEDVGDGDLTTEGVVPEQLRCRAELLVEEAGVVCGVPLALEVFVALDPAVSGSTLIEEGARIDGTTAVAQLEGPARAILTGERTALNLLGRLSGVATLTARYVDARGARGLDVSGANPERPRA